MCLLRVTVSYKEDFLTFDVKDSCIDGLSAGDRIKYNDHMLVVMHRIHIARKEQYYECGDIIFECVVNNHSLVDFYKCIDYFQGRFEFIGNLMTNRVEPHMAYKIYRLFVRLMPDSIKDAVMSTKHAVMVDRLFEVLGLDFDEIHFRRFGDEVDLLEYLFSCITDDDVDPSVFDDFDVIQSQFIKHFEV